MSWTNGLHFFGLWTACPQAMQSCTVCSSGLLHWSDTDGDWPGHCLAKSDQSDLEWQSEWPDNDCVTNQKFDRKLIVQVSKKVLSFKQTLWPAEGKSVMWSRCMETWSDSGSCKLGKMHPLYIRDYTNACPYYTRQALVLCQLHNFPVSTFKCIYGHQGRGVTVNAWAKTWTG